MRNPTFLWIIIAVMLLLDIYIFQAVKTVLPASSPRIRMSIIVIYWFLAILALGTLIAYPYLNYESWPRQVRTYVFALLVAAFFSKLVATVFLAVDDLRRGATWLLMRIARNPDVGTNSPQEGISRSVFLSWLGLAMGGGLLTTFVYGFSNKYNYQVRREKMAFNNLPSAFKGLRIVHISDIHAGSFMDKSAVMKGIATIMKEKPDMILFTGDLVNDRASEMDEYAEVFSQLSAPLGVFSTLGNHDYGDYVQWESLAAKRDNLEKLKAVHKTMGWRLLMNENVIIEKEGQQIAVLGVENWSAKGRFPKYGVLKRAYTGAAQVPFKILLSHDPSHWEGQILPEYPDIDLTLSGHTHGMQFGVEIPGFRWSPVQYMYKQWAGLYENGVQRLYINRGFGFIGYPGRVGILPEISVLTLT